MITDMLLLGWLLKHFSDCSVALSILVGWFLDFADIMILVCHICGVGCGIILLGAVEG